MRLRATLQVGTCRPTEGLPCVQAVMINAFKKENQHPAIIQNLEVQTSTYVGFTSKESVQRLSRQDLCKTFCAGLFLCWRLPFFV